MRLFERLIFFSLLATIPIQLGKHFWPEFSFVQGIRVDYLAPTFYVTDIIFLLLFVISLKRLSTQLFAFFKKPVFVALALGVIVALPFSYSPLESVYSALKLFEFLYIGIYVSRIEFKKYREDITFLFLLGGLVEVVIAFFQFCSQASLGGVFYYLGERTFSVSTPGIATFRLGEHLILRSYGTFPHPNVLAFYLLIGFTFLLFSLRLKNERKTIIFSICLAILLVGIILTFSRSIIIFVMAIIMIWAIKYASGMRKQIRVRIGVVAALGICITISLLMQRLSGEILRDVAYRLELFLIGLKVFVSHPLGVGLNNFYYHEILFQKQITPTLLQPIHNIYALFIVHLGFFAFGIFGFLSIQIVKYWKGGVIGLLMVSALLVGLIDHYLVTLQQGQLMFSLLLGLYFNKVKE